MNTGKRKQRPSSSNSNDDSDASDPEGNVGDERVPERPRRSCAVNVPSTGRVAAGDDLPNWTVERADALDGSSFLLYRNPRGEAIGSRKSALTYTGQLELPASAYEAMGEVMREHRRHCQRLSKYMTLSATLTKHRLPPKRMRIDYPQLVRSRLTPPTESPGQSTVVVDLYCGLGGLSLGLRTCGFSHIGGVDKCATAVGIFNENRCGTWGLCRRIRPLDIPRWKEAFVAAGLCKSEHTTHPIPLIIVGGPPCQPYSQRGMRMGSGDERDGLTLMVDITIDARPLAMIIENVPTLLDERFSVPTQAQFSRLAKAGYSLSARVHGSWEHRVPQLRRRLVIVALRRDAWAHEPPDITNIHAMSDTEPIPLPWDALMDSQEGDALWKGPCPPHLRIDPISLRSRERIATATQTAGLVVAGRPCPTVLTTCLSGNSWQRLVVVPTQFSGEPSKEKYGHLRMLTAEHVKRLQSFPSDFKLYGHARMQGLLLGNAVPPLMANDIGRTLCDAIASRIEDGSTLEKASRACRILQTQLAQRLTP